MQSVIVHKKLNQRKPQRKSQVSKQSITETEVRWKIPSRPQTKSRADSIDNWRDKASIRDQSLSQSSDDSIGVLKERSLTLDWRDKTSIRDQSGTPSSDDSIGLVAPDNGDICKSNADASEVTDSTNPSSIDLTVSSNNSLKTNGKVIILNSSLNGNIPEVSSTLDTLSKLKHDVTLSNIDFINNMINISKSKAENTNDKMSNHTDFASASKSPIGTTEPVNNTLFRDTSDSRLTADIKNMPVIESNNNNKVINSANLNNQGSNPIIKNKRKKNRISQ